MSKHILILEDDMIQAEHLAKMIQDFSNNITATIVSNIADAKKKILESTIFDAFFLDIAIGDISTNQDGLQLAHFVQSTSRYANTPIVFLTAYPEHIYSAINNLHCFAYLIKPYHEKEVRQQLRSLFVSTQTISIKTTEGIYVRFPMDSLLYVESYGRYLTYVTTSASYRSRQYTLKHLEPMLSSNFIRCHKSFIINELCVESYDYANHLAYLKENTEPIPLRRSFNRRLEHLT